MKDNDIVTIGGDDEIQFESKIKKDKLKKKSKESEPIEEDNIPDYHFQFESNQSSGYSEDIKPVKKKEKIKKVKKIKDIEEPIILELEKSDNIKFKKSKDNDEEIEPDFIAQKPNNNHSLLFTKAQNDKQVETISSKIPLSIELPVVSPVLNNSQEEFPKNNSIDSEKDELPVLPSRLKLKKLNDFKQEKEKPIITPEVIDNHIESSLPFPKGKTTKVETFDDSKKEADDDNPSSLSSISKKANGEFEINVIEEIPKKCPKCNGKIKKTWLKSLDGFKIQKFRCINTKKKRFYQVFRKKQELCDYKKEIKVRLE